MLHAFYTNVNFSLNRSTDRDRDREKDREKDKIKEKERERRKKGLPSIKENLANSKYTAVIIHQHNHFKKCKNVCWLRKDVSVRFNSNSL